jgi:succinyl-diaminopimelate desuccinylase
MERRERVIERVKARRQELIGLCQELVRIPSEDPPGDNRHICRFLQDYLRRHGVTGSIHGPDSQRPNLLAVIPFPKPGPNLVFNGHMETLPVGDVRQWSHEPFGAVIDTGRIWGRGTRCMKGGIAALTIAALAVMEHREDLHGTLTLMFVSDEVNGGRVGTEWMLNHVPQAKADLALVGEGGPWINFGHKGPVFVEFTATGESAHGAYTYCHASAIHRMVELIRELRALEEGETATPAGLRSQLEESRSYADEVYGAGATDALMRVSANVGVIRGGRKVNMIADQCEAEVDFRLPHGMAASEFLERIEGIVKHYPGVTFHTRWANDPTAADLRSPWLQLLRRTSQDIFGTPYLFGCTHGYSDARFFHLRGIPTAAIAASGGNVGSPDEFIDIESLDQTAQLFALATYRQLKAPETEKPRC